MPALTLKWQRGMKKTKANFFHVIPLLPTSEVMDDVLEDSSAVTKDGMDGEFVELPFPPCDFEVPVSDGMLHFTTAMAKWIPNSWICEICKFLYP